MTFSLSMVLMDSPGAFSLLRVLLLNLEVELHCAPFWEVSVYKAKPILLNLGFLVERSKATTCRQLNFILGNDTQD